MTAAARAGLLEEMTEVIVTAARPRRIILFGSWARGEEQADSDVDLLVEEDGPFGPEHSRRKEMARLTRLLARFAVRQDILVYSADEVARWAGSRNHVVGRALREGKVLYERH
jgi:predicted nucleotidyltransferase